MLGKDGELTHDHRQLAVALGVEIEGDLVGPGRLGARDVLVIEAHARVGLLVHAERIDHVLRRDGRAVLPARLVAQLERDRGIIGRIARPFGDQPVRGRGLIQTVGHQAFIDEPEPCSRLALVEHRIEAIEGADIGHAHDAAFRRIGIDIIELLEICWDISARRSATARDGGRARPRLRAGDREKQGKEEGKRKARNELMLSALKLLAFTSGRRAPKRRARSLTWRRQPAK